MRAAQRFLQHRRALVQRLRRLEQRGDFDAVGAAGKATVAKSATVDVWDRVASLRPAQPEIPEGAFTLKEYMTRFQISMGVARRELARLLASGAVATEMGKNTAAGCAGHPERMYWLI